MQMLQPGAFKGNEWIALPRETSKEPAPGRRWNVPRALCNVRCRNISTIDRVVLVGPLQDLP